MTLKITNQQEDGIDMKKEKILELFRRGADYCFTIPAGTPVDEIEKVLGYFIVDVARYRGITSEQFLEEIKEWVQQLNENL